MIYRLQILIILGFACMCGSAVQAQGMAALDFESYADVDTVCVRVNNGGIVLKIKLLLTDAVNPNFGTTGPRLVRKVSGFEARLNVPSSVEIVQVDYPIPATNAGTDDDLMITYAVPQTVYADQTLVLAEVWVAIAADSELATHCASSQDYLGLSPAIDESAVGPVGFYDADDPEAPFVEASSGRTLIVYGYDVVSTEHESWGSLKAIYR